MQLPKSLAVAAMVVGVAGGSYGIASAASGGSSTTTTTTVTTPSQSASPAFNGPAHGSAAHEDAEKAVTGTAATKAQTAAVSAAGGGTAGAVTTDYTGGGYEVDVTKSDGSTIQIHLDSSFNVVGGSCARH